MALMKIVKFPARVLKVKARPVTNFGDKKLSQLIKDMTETMYDAPGVGLAANQVGHSLRLAVIDARWKQDDEVRDLHIFIHPKIIEKSDLIDFDEGCLSLPGVTATVKRFNKVTVQYLDEQEKKRTLKAEGLLAIAIQHETDHLNGKLYIDHLSPLKRDMLIKRFKKLK